MNAPSVQGLLVLCIIAAHMVVWTDRDILLKKRSPIKKNKKIARVVNNCPCRPGHSLSYFDLRGYFFTCVNDLMCLFQEP